MVKEIRDAAQIRENVLFSKTEALIERNASTKNMVRQITIAEYSLIIIRRIVNVSIVFDS